MALFKLGAFAESLSGKSGNTVFVRTKAGTVVRDFVIPTNPDTAAQQGVRSYFGLATTAFRNMTSSQVQTWNNYASQFTTRTRAGKLRKRTGINVFTALTTKFLQVTPTGTIPLTPPTSAFAGETITLTVTPGDGQLQFTASGPNTSGVKTEILFQRLAAPNRKPERGAYRHKQFVTFASGSLSVSIVTEPGYWATAYRFVKTATGQASDLIPLPVQTMAFAVVAGGADKQKKAA